ncbi:MAG: molybdate ABC transporter ATP-binding protein ModF [Granulosicoccus sp.]
MSNNPIILDQLCVDFDAQFQLHDICWSIAIDQQWMISGTNGSGKSALAAVLAGAGDIVSGSLLGVPARVALVSYEAQAELIAAELRKDDADIMDVISEGTPVHEIIDAVSVNATLARELASQFGISHLMDRSFRKLSTGETRKVMLIRALTSEPELLVLDEPFDGLDANTHQLLLEHLQALSKTLPMVLVLNRFDERPGFISHIAYVDEGRLVSSVDCADRAAYNDLYQLLHIKTSDLSVPPADPAFRLPILDPAQPLVRISNATIQYSDTVIFKDLSWTIQAGEHWQLTGPNGSGKTGLLSLITGDHPQCYVNDIFVFGYQRGQGETIWQIKQFIGYVSTALQWEYRVSTSLRHVVISGFYDSIGLYSKYTDNQRNIADQWLGLLGMHARADDPFNQLSHGEKRLLLIARAMVKHPPLLILDEPCLGLDDMNRQLVLALIEKICRSSTTTVLYVNHHAHDRIPGIEQHLALGATNSV